MQSYDSVLRLNDKHWRSMLNKAVALIGLHQDRAAQLSLKQAYQISGAVALPQSHSHAYIHATTLSAAFSILVGDLRVAVLAKAFHGNLTVKAAAEHVTVGVVTSMSILQGARTF